MLGYILGSVFRVPFNFCSQDFQLFFFETIVESQDMAPRATVPFPRSLAFTPDSTLCCSIEAITHCWTGSLTLEQDVMSSLIPEGT